jgi:hypothetical protein
VHGGTQQATGCFLCGEERYIHEQEHASQIVRLARGGAARIEFDRRQQRGVRAGGSKRCGESRRTSARHFRASFARAGTHDRRSPATLHGTEGGSVRGAAAFDRTERTTLLDSATFDGANGAPVGYAATFDRAERNSFGDSAAFDGAEQQPFRDTATVYGTDQHALRVTATVDCTWQYAIRIASTFHRATRSRCQPQRSEKPHADRGVLFRRPTTRGSFQTGNRSRSSGHGPRNRAGSAGDGAGVRTRLIVVEHPL